MSSIEVKRLLAIETSEQACSVALMMGAVSDSVAIDKFDMVQQLKVAPREHAMLVLPMVEQVLSEAECTMSQLDAIAFARGPGAFTGLRIGASTTQGLALGMDVGVIPVSTLMAMAEGAWRREAAGRVIAALDARMQEVYIGGFERLSDGAWQVALPEQVSRPDQLQGCNEGGSVSYDLGVGSGWIYEEALQAQLGSMRVEMPWHCEAQDVARLAWGALCQGKLLPSEQALPVYLRDNVASVKKP